MPVQNRVTLKSYFETGDQPTESNFEDLIDSLLLVSGDTTTGAIVLNADPTNALEAATKGYVDNLVTGLSWKQSVVAATTNNITLSGTQTIDGVAVLAGDRVLVKNQTTATENGIYLVDAGAWTRAGDNNTGAEIAATTVLSEGGTVNGGTQWNCSNSSITLGSTNITFVQIAGAGVYTNGTGIVLSGNTFSIDSNVATLTGSQTLTNKTLTSPVVNSPTGIVKGDVGLGNVDNTSDATKNSATATLTNKTLTSPVINSPTGIVKGDVGLGNVDNTSDATKNSATATLTNKTLTNPIISTISNTGTLTLPTSTDTLVGRTTTDTLTNKTLTSPTINGGTLTAITNLGIRDTSAAFDVKMVATSSSALTADRILTIDMINTARTIKLGGNITTAANFITSGANSLTLTTTGTTNVTLPTSGTLAVLASPAFSGTPTSTTAAVDTNTTQIATTAFVIGQGYAKLASPSLTTPNIGVASGTSLAATGTITSSGTAGIGYATGAGGTVTQATSKSTGVTLNKICGEITMHNALLARSTAVSFTLTNSTIGANDVLILNHASAGTAGSYGLNAQAASGSATISVRNLQPTGGGGADLSEAIVIRFVVIKAVNS